MEGKHKSLIPRRPNQCFSAVPAAEAQDPLDLKQTRLSLRAHQQFYKLAVKFHQILAQPDLSTQRYHIRYIDTIFICAIVYTIGNRRASAHSHQSVDVHALFVEKYELS